MKMEATARVPLCANWAKASWMVREVQGNYSPQTQKWSCMDVTAGSTWSRTGTTGWTGGDPDEDKDD